MKTNSKSTNTNFGFSKNFFKALVAPLLVIVLAIVFAFTIGFNKNIDYTGGIYVSAVANTVEAGRLDLEDSEVYSEFKANIDDVLEENNVKGQVYSVELNEMQEYVLVVKFAFEGTDAEKQTLIENVKDDLVNALYSSMPAEDLENNHYLIVSEFGGAISVMGYEYLTTILATLVCAIVVCAYMAIRLGLNAGVLSFVSFAFNNILAISLICVARVPLTYASIIAIPFVSVLSLLSSYLYFKKAKDLLSSTDIYERKNNFALADDIVKQTMSKQTLLFGVSAVSLLLLGLVNVCNSVLFLCLALFTCVACMLFTNIFILPGLFARTYVRKVKKSKQPKKQEVQENKLTEEQIMKETDLDNLVSN